MVGNVVTLRNVELIADTSERCQQRWTMTLCGRILASQGNRQFLSENSIYSTNFLLNLADTAKGTINFSQDVFVGLSALFVPPLTSIPIFSMNKSNIQRRRGNAHLQLMVGLDVWEKGSNEGRPSCSD